MLVDQRGGACPSFALDLRSLALPPFAHALPHYEKETTDDDDDKPNKNHHGHGHSQYLVDRMDQARGFDILGLIGNALNMYQDSQQDKTEDYYVYQ